MSSSPTEQLKEWYVSFVKLFREEYSKLSEEEKRQLLLNHDCNPPCQIEVFWLGRPNWQFIVTTHFGDRPDLEIIINGPYDSTVFHDEVKKIINHARWKRPLYRNVKNRHIDSPRYYSEFLAERLHTFVERAKNAMFIRFPNDDRIFTESIRLDEGLIEHVYGDVRRFDPKLLVKKMVEDAKEQNEYGKKSQKLPKEQKEPEEHHEGFGTYFFPPIIIGKMSKPSVNDKLYGVKNIGFRMFDKKAFDVKFGKTFVIITKDGYIGVCAASKDAVIEILNTIMAIMELEGIEAHAVREHELSKIDYDPKTLNITGYTYSFNTPRNELFQETRQEKILEYQIREIDEEQIKGILKKASKTFEDDETSKAIRDFGDMLIHLKDSEFPQALLKGWTVIEQYLSQKWKEEIYSAKIGRKETHPKRFPKMDIILKDLKVKISPQQFETFMTMKGIRNKHLHEGKQVTKMQAKDCMGVAKEIVLKKYHAHLPR